MTIIRTLATNTYSGYGIIFKPVKSIDLIKLRHWRNSKEISAYMINSDHISAKQQAEWFRAKLRNDDFAHWIIMCNDIKTGYVNIHKSTKDNSGITMSGGYYLVDSPVRHGLLGYAVVLMYHDIIFDIVGANSISDIVFEHNSNARRLNEQFGYSEGLVKKGLIKISLQRENYYTARKKLLRYFNKAEISQVK